MATTCSIAAAPFDKRCGADVIFRTPDNVDFFLHKTVLSLASTFFQSMFTLSQPSSAAIEQESDPLDELPVVEVSEDSLTLDHLLRCCYPVREPAMTDLQVVDRVLGAAIKYAMEATVELAMRALRGFVETQPLQVYAVSCRHACEDEARLAAEEWKKTREEWSHTAETFARTTAGLCYIREMENLPAGFYLRLIRFVSGSLMGSRVKFCDPYAAPKAELKDKIDPSRYPFDHPGADVIVRSTDGIEFRIHRLIVEMQITANPTFPLQATLLSSGVPELDSGIDGLPVIQARETGPVLQRLLRLCYPITGADAISNWSADVCCRTTTVNIIAAALRYGMTSIVEQYSARLRDISLEAPLGVYCISISFGWFELATTVASDMAMNTNPFLSNPYHANVEMLTTTEYRQLLEYSHTVHQTMCRTVERSLSIQCTQWKVARQNPATAKNNRIPLPVVEWAVEQAVTVTQQGKKHKCTLSSIITKGGQIDAELRKALNQVKLRLY